MCERPGPPAQGVRPCLQFRPSRFERCLERPPRVRIGRVYGGYQCRDATGVFATYARTHRRTAQALGRALDLGFSDPVEVASAAPVIRFTFG